MIILLTVRIFGTAVGIQHEFQLLDFSLQLADLTLKIIVLMFQLLGCLRENKLFVEFSGDNSWQMEYDYNI